MTTTASSATATGHCLCGAVSLTFSRDAVLGSGHCHCTDCQRATGSGKATIVFVPETALERTGELRAFEVTGTDGSHVRRSFCPTCGSQLLSAVREQPGLVFVKAGCLEESDWISPQASYWTASARRWSPADSSTVAFTGNPTPIADSAVD